jgi:formylglycine-generating enzyme required for sulfatase activity
VETFHIADSQVDGDLWKRFLADRSNWAGDQKKALIEKSLVDGGYLEISGDPQFPNPSVSGISHHAASAFCGWLSDRLPPELSGYEVRLPTEAEWERAAGFYPQMLGGLWEWCADPFAPLDFLPAPDWAIRQVGSSEFTVKGGSWANQSGTVTASTRASLPPDSCSDFVGFRPVLVRASAPATEGIGRR